MNTWPEQFISEYKSLPNHPGTFIDRKKCLATLEKMSQKKKQEFLAIWDVYKRELRSKPGQQQMQLTYFLHSKRKGWTVMEPVNVSKPTEPRSTVKEWVKPADRPDSEELFNKTMARLRG